VPGEGRHPPADRHRRLRGDVPLRRFPERDRSRHPVTAYPADALFSVLYTTSDGVGVTAGGWYDYLFAAADGSLVTSYNSTGTANSVVHTGVGAYRVTVVNRGTIKLSGNVHLNAVNSTAAAR
jgi:hypothetical protein